MPLSSLRTCIFLRIGGNRFGPVMQMRWSRDSVTELTQSNHDMQIVSLTMAAGTFRGQ